MSIKPHCIASLLTLLALLSCPCAVRAGGPGFATLAGDPAAVAAGSRMAPRSALVPYPSREEALAGGASSYVVPLEGWKSESVPEGVRYTARFKVRYAWDNRAVLLRVEDVPSSFGIEVNGERAGYSQAGMGRTEFDITGFIRPDYNTVSVVVCEAPAAARIGEGLGASPEAWPGRACVVSQPSVRIDDLFVETSVEDGYGYVALDVVLQSILLNPKEYTIFYELLDPKGEVVAMSQKGIVTDMRSRDTVRFTVRIPDPLAWNHETPDLYTLLVRSRHEGRFVENIALRIGFRTPGTAQGVFTMDGLPVGLYSVRYAARQGKEATAAELERLKWEGYNCIVAEGAPQPDYFYGLCDSLGLYVCDAAHVDTSREPARIDVGGNPSNDPQWLASYIDRMHRMYYASHLHPSVVMYAPARDSRNGYCLYESYMELKRLAPGIPVFYDGADGEWNSDLTASEVLRYPYGVPPSGRVSLVWEMGARELVVLNNRELSVAKGTYRVSVRSGVRTVQTLSGELRLMGGAAFHVPLALPEELRKGSVEVEVSVLKEVSAQETGPGAKVSDLYEVIKAKFPL